MSEAVNRKPELDDNAIDSWHVAFAAYATYTGTTPNRYNRLTKVLYALPTELGGMLSLGKHDYLISLRVTNTTQKQAVLKAYGSLLDAYDSVEDRLVIKSASIARLSGL